MNGPDSSSAQLDAVARVDRLFERNAIDYWLFGGWAVDFHVGAITRGHADVDVAVVAPDIARVTQMLESDGWRHRPDWDGDGYAGYEGRGVRLEVALLARDEHGRFYTPIRDGRGEWPSGAFGNDVVVLHGVRARVIERRALIAEKSVVHDDVVVADKDHADLARLGRESE